jgi:hydroxymethylpyrimidine/phosphomethylpyrimidine kinase
VATDLRPAAVKTGMLADGVVIRTVAAGIARHRLAPYVLDPVMVATSGDPLLKTDGIEAIRRELMPLCDLLTPNLDEAALLVGHSVRSVEEMREAAARLVEEGAKAVLVKGGHLEGPETVDVLHDGSAMTTYRHERVETRSTHGTGCTLSAAITAHLAQGFPLHDAVQLSLDWVHRAIASAPALGSGNGPLNHFA